MFFRTTIRPFLAAGFVVIFTTAATDPVAVPIARAILDDAKPQSDREAIVKDNPKLSADLIAVMTSDLTAGTKEEYRRIPWIWRVAIAAGKRNDA